MARPSKIVTKEDILRAQQNTRSNIYIYLITTIRSMLRCLKMTKE